MQEKDMNDYIIEIYNDFSLIVSSLKVLTNSINNENNNLQIEDISNSLEIIFSKSINTKIALNKYIDYSFDIKLK